MDARTRSLVAAPILVAFGVETSRRSVRMWLEDEGYEVRETGATASTIAYLHFAQAPHIVLLDYYLPPGTAEPLLHIVTLDATLQRHRYILSLRPNRLLQTFSNEAERLIYTLCTDVVENPLDMEHLRATIEQGSGVTAGQGVEPLPLPVPVHAAHHRPGTLGSALTQVVRQLHLRGRG